MGLYEELEEFKKELGENLEMPEYCEVKKYLEENPNLLLTDLYNNREIMDQFEKWKFDKEIKNRKVFAVVYMDNKMQIDYLKVIPDKYGYNYTDGIYIYNKKQLFLTLQEAKDSLWNHKKSYVYTERTEKYINSIEEDKKELIKEYYGESKLENVWFKKVNELNEKKIDRENLRSLYKRLFRSLVSS